MVVTLIDMNNNRVDVVIEDNKLNRMLNLIKKSEQYKYDNKGNIVDNYYSVDVRCLLLCDCEVTEDARYLSKSDINTIKKSNFEIEYLHKVIINGKELPSKMVLSYERDLKMKAKGLIPQPLRDAGCTEAKTIIEYREENIYVQNDYYYPTLRRGYESASKCATLEDARKWIDARKWGGAREGAGRPSKGNVQFNCRMPQSAISELRRRAKEQNKAIGDYLCEVLDLI